MGVLIGALAAFMVATVGVALWQEDMGWGWWWAVPVGGGFVLLIVAARLLVQRAQEAAERADREADEAVAAEREEA